MAYGNRGEHYLRKPVGDGEPILVTKDVTVRFGEIVAVDDVSIEVREGGILAIMGSNGAGED